MKNFLLQKIKTKEQEQKAWLQKKNSAVEEIQQEIEKLKKQKEKNGIVLQEMREKQIENEMETHQ